MLDKKEEYCISPVRLIHFIWAGGTNALPKNDNAKQVSNHHIIRDWQDCNPDFQALLWVDIQSLSKTTRQEYQKRGYQFVEDVSCLSISTLENVHNKKKLLVVDIAILFEKASEFFSKNEIEDLQALIFYEMKNSFHPNYGASSDLLRYLVLLVYGGAYFDSDVQPGDSPLSCHPAFRKYAYFSGFNVIVDESNDALICSRAHPFLVTLLKKAFQNYKHQKPELLNTFNFRWFTLYRTGPDLVLKNVPNISNYKLKKKFIYQKNRIGNKSWTKYTITSTSSINEAVQLATKSMLAEMKYMNVCRLAEHVHGVGLSLRENILRIMRKIITISRSPSLWDEFVINLDKKYNDEIDAYEATYPSLTFADKKYNFSFNKIEESIRKEINKGKDNKNFAMVCADIKDFLQKNEIETNKINNVLEKLHQRYPLLQFYRQKIKRSILGSIGAYEHSEIAYLRVTDIFLEENIFHLALPTMTQQSFTKTLSVADLDETIIAELQSSYYNLIRLLQSSKPVGIILSDLSDFHLNVSYQKIFNLLELLNPHTNKNFSEFIASEIIKKLKTEYDIKSLLENSMHHQADEVFAEWVQFKLSFDLSNAKVGDSVARDGNYFSEKLTQEKAMQLTLYSLKRLLCFFEKCMQDCLSIQDPAKVKNEILLSEFYNEFPDLIKSIEECLGFANFPFPEEAKLGIQLFLMSFSIAGEAVMKNF